MGRRMGREIALSVAVSLPAMILGCNSAPVRDLVPVASLDDQKAPAHTPRTAAEKSATMLLQTAAQFEKKGQTGPAILQYERARQLDPKLTDVAHRLALLYDRQGDMTRAAGEFKKAMDARPKDANLLNDIGYHCYRRGDWAGAEGWLRQALALNPKLQQGWIHLGMTLAQQEKTREALDAFTKVVSPAQAKSDLGMILAQHGNVEDAKQAFRESLALEPNSARTRAALARLDKGTRARMTAN
jgi:Tfp pilus assembly protein PilF